MRIIRIVRIRAVIALPHFTPFGCIFVLLRRIILTGFAFGQFSIWTLALVIRFGIFLYP